MLIERRVILFTRSDLLDAMRRYGERAGKTLPDVPPEFMQCDPANDPAFVVRFRASVKGAPPQQIVFAANELSTAMQNYCRDHKIPLPRRAAKTVEKHKDGAALTMYLGNPGLHVMIVDDQESVRGILKKLVSKANPAEVTEAADGSQALSILQTGAAEPDIILCDLHMDKMDGMEFLRRLRADKANVNSSKPVILLTSDKTDVVRQNAMMAGASRVLSKPIAGDELIRQIMLTRGYFELDQSTSTAAE